jgi:hypothetical protein
MTTNNTQNFQIIDTRDLTVSPIPDGPVEGAPSPEERAQQTADRQNQNEGFERFIVAPIGVAVPQAVADHSHRFWGGRIVWFQRRTWKENGVEEATVDAIDAALERRRTRGMISTGSIVLPTGDKIEAGQGGAETCGSDCYPITIVGWNKSGRRLFYRAAIATPTERHDHFGSQDYTYTPDPDADIKVATWRAPRTNRPGDGGIYRPRGQDFGRVYLDGYECYRDPHF